MLILKQNNTCTRRDPDVVLHNGYYYYCCADAGQRVLIAKTKDLAKLEEAEFVEVWHAEPTGLRSKSLWAPELHIIDGKCYIYTCLDDGDNRNHRMYVLENFSDDPQKPYTLHGKICDENDQWGIDGTVIKYNGELYYAWSGWEHDYSDIQYIFFAKMKDPYTLSSKTVKISAPDQPFERLGAEPSDKRPYVNEGPFGLQHGNDLYVFYSGSGCWTNYYCVCYVKYSGGDILDPKNWVKCKEPVLTSSEYIKGTGHASFFTKDGEDYIVYHGFEKDASFGERTVDVRCQKVEWVNNLPFIGEAK